MNQTAIEWLIENSHIIPKNELNKRELIKQAKEMEKQQIVNAVYDAQRTDFYVKYYDAEQYYNKTYKNEKI